MCVFRGATRIYSKCPLASVLVKIIAYSSWTVTINDTQGYTQRILLLCISFYATTTHIKATLIQLSLFRDEITKTAHLRQDFVTTCYKCLLREEMCFMNEVSIWTF
jgi:hypothetical protein